MNAICLGRVAKVAAAGCLVVSLSGCLAALAVPLVTTAGVTAATNSSVDNTLSYAEQVSRMNCNQLRAEYTKLDGDVLARANPLGNWAGRRAAVQSAASQRGCSLPT